MLGEDTEGASEGNESGEVGILGLVDFEICSGRLEEEKLFFLARDTLCLAREVSKVV